MNVTLPSITIIESINQKIDDLERKLENKTDDLYQRFRKVAGQRYGLFRRIQLSTEWKIEFLNRTRPLFFVWKENQLAHSLQRSIDKKIAKLESIRKICDRFPEITLVEEEIRLIYV